MISLMPLAFIWMVALLVKSYNSCHLIFGSVLSWKLWKFNSMTKFLIMTLGFSVVLPGSLWERLNSYICFYNFGCSRYSNFHFQVISHLS